MKLENLDEMRDCVREAYLDGSERGDHFIKMRHAIISELKRLKYDPSQIKDELLEWNKRCEKPLSASEQKRQLLDYVDWFEKKESKTGCTALQNYCIGYDKCLFYKNKVATSIKVFKELPFQIEELEKFLRIRYKAKAEILLEIVRVMRKAQVDKAAGEVIFIGFREIASRLRDEYHYMLEAAEIQRFIHLLVDEGVLMIIVKGKAGTFGMKRANGYSFMQWQAPWDTLHTHNNSNV